jgi:hypothetical protein
MDNPSDYIIKESISGIGVIRDGKLVNTYEGMRAAVIWPNAAVPGYFLIMACSPAKEFKDGVPRLRFIYELQDGSLQSMFRSILQCADKYCVRGVLAHLDSGDESWQIRSLFGQIKRFTHKNSKVDLVPASFTGTLTGIPLALIGQWRPGLQIDDESILRRQLGSIKRDSLNEGRIDDKFNAIKALAFIIADIERNPVQDRTPFVNAQAVVGAVTANRVAKTKRRGIV